MIFSYSKEHCLKKIHTFPVQRYSRKTVIISERLNLVKEQSLGRLLLSYFCICFSVSSPSFASEEQSPMDEWINYHSEYIIFDT